MKNKKSSIAILVSIVLLVLACALVLSACKNDNGGSNTPTPDSTETEKTNEDKTNEGEEGKTNEDDKTNENDHPDNTDENGTEVETPELTVSFDETSAFPMDMELLSNALDVKIVSEGADRKVAFVIQSAEITPDGQYIEITISAEGMEKTIRLPYEGKEPLPIREELKPLYNLFTKDGNKAVSLTVSGEMNLGELVSQDFASSMILNLIDGDVQFAYVNDADEESDGKAEILYRDGVLNIGGVSVSIGDFTEYLALLSGGLFDGFDFGEEEIEADEDDLITADAGFALELLDEDSLDELFLALSQALDTLDRVFDNPLVASMNLGFGKQDGAYTIKSDTKKLIKTIQFFADDDDAEFDLNKIIDILDEQMGGALKSGDIKISMALSVKEEYLAFAVEMENKKTGDGCVFSFNLQVSEEAFELPEGMEAIGTFDLSTMIETIKNIDWVDMMDQLKSQIQDVEITIPLALPQRDFDAELRAVICLSNLLGTDTDYITATVRCNDTEEAIRFLLDNEYVYMDINGLAAMLGNEPSPTFKFYKAFEIAGEPTSLTEMIQSMVFGRFSEITDFGNDDFASDTPDETGDGNESGYEGDISEDVSEDVSGGFSSFGYSTLDSNPNLLFPIGATEQDLRDDLIVEAFDDEGNEIIITDYEIVGFDSSASSVVEITLLLPYDWQIMLDVTVYNPETVYQKAVSLDKFYVALGTGVVDAQKELFADITMSDGEVEWIEYRNCFTIDSINFVPVASDSVFDHVGSALLVVKQTETGEPFFQNAYVYDPENLQVIDFDCSDEVYLDPGATEEDLREELWASVIYDNGSEFGVEDYEIEGFEPGAELIQLKWGENFSGTVRVVWNIGDEPETGFNLMSLLQYLRPLDFAESDDPEVIFAGISEVAQKAGELFSATFSTDDGLRIVINADDDQDLLAIINLFFGIPTEEGWQDLDEDLLMSYLEDQSLGFFSISAAFEKLTGVALEDFVSNLYLTANTSDGLVLQLTNGGEMQYLVIGANAQFVEAAPSVVLADGETENAQEFSNVLSYAIMLLVQAILLA